MTVCVAAIADSGKSLVLVADRLFGMGYIETEGSEHKKILDLCENWWVMFAADDVSCLFPIMDLARLNASPKMTATQIGDCLFDAFVTERNGRAEQQILRPRGYSISSFQLAGLPQCGAEMFRDISNQFFGVKLNLDLLACGFDTSGRAVILHVSDDGVSRRDIPGFASIGSGHFGATYMMFYRDLSPKMSTREVVYYAVEAKFFGEQAGGVGEDTDLYVVRPGVPPVVLDPTQLDEQVFTLCTRLSPRNLVTPRNVDALNSIELGNTVEQVEINDEGKIVLLQKADKVGQ